VLGVSLNTFSDSISDPERHCGEQIRISRMHQSLLQIPSVNATHQGRSGTGIQNRLASPDFKTHHDPVQRFEPQRSVEGLRCIVAPIYLQFERADSFPPAEVANCLDHSRAEALAAMTLCDEQIRHDSFDSAELEIVVVSNDRIAGQIARPNDFSRSNRRNAAPVTRASKAIESNR